MIRWVWVRERRMVRRWGAVWVVLVWVRMSSAWLSVVRVSVVRLGVWARQVARCWRQVACLMGVLVCSYRVRAWW